MDNGVLKSGWEIVMERTDPRWVVAQIDIGWAVCGAAGAAAGNRAAGEAYVTAMINKFSTTPHVNRIVSFHVKDVVNARLACNNDDQRTLGQGEINFAPMFTAAANRVKYYFAERDPVGIGGPTDFNPFNNTADSAANLKGAPIGVAKAAPQQFNSVPAGTAAANNVKPVVITNDGDGPLVFTTAPADDRGRDQRRRRHDRGRLRGRQPELLGHDAPARRHVHDQRRLQADAHELHVGRAPAVHLELRRRGRARAARRHEHGRVAQQRGRRRPEPAVAQHHARRPAFGIVRPGPGPQLRHRDGRRW